MTICFKLLLIIAVDCMAAIQLQQPQHMIGLSEIESNILGGHKVHPPFKYGGWMAAVMVNGVQYCGGSLIAERYLLTAAHCSERIIRGRRREITVQLHRFDLSKPVLEEQAIEFPVLRAHIHPRYDKPQDGYLANDVAIWELGEPRLFGSSAQIQPIVMADTALPSDYHMATVIGWGETRRRDYSDHLKQVNLPVWQWNDCVKEHGSGDIHRGMLCAGGRSHKDACHGDSGGPLIVRSADGRPILIGLVSWGLLCGVKGLPGVYTNVSYYLPWIQSIVG